MINWHIEINLRAGEEGPKVQVYLAAYAKAQMGIRRKWGKENSDKRTTDLVRLCEHDAC